MCRLTGVRTAGSRPSLSSAALLIEAAASCPQDFVVQFQVAFSATVKGVGVFAGQVRQFLHRSD